MDGFSATVSYRLQTGSQMLDSAHIELRPGSPCLIIGENDQAYHALGGVLARLLPLTDADVPWEFVQRLLDPFTGTVHVSDGRLPQSSVYVGPDPDRLLLYSRVEDNFRSRGITLKQSLVALSLFDLGPSFLHRRLAVLSGGERMRVALALAFSDKHEALILDGVMPWLDHSGREALRNQIRTCSSSCIVIFENEWEDILPVVKQVYRLANGKLHSLDINGIGSASSRSAARTTATHTSYTAPILRFSNVCFFDYPDTEVVRSAPLLDNASFDVYPGQHTCIVGPNGAGKSTIAKLIYGILSPDSGEIRLDGGHPSAARHRQASPQVGYLGQYPLQQLPLPTVGSYKKHCSRKGNEIAVELIKSWVAGGDDAPVVDLTALDQKLLALASGITCSTKLIILDEPTWGLSGAEQEAFIEHLLRWCNAREGRSILVISHSKRFGERLGCRLLFLDLGTVSEYQSTGLIVSQQKDDIRERRLRSILRRVPLWAKVLTLVIVATFSFGFVFFVRSSDLGTYCLLLAGVTSAVVLLLGKAVRRAEFRLLIIAWAAGSLIYAAVAAYLVFSGASLSPYMILESPSSRWLYVLSYPVRMLAVLATGMLFVEFTSPLEFGRASKLSRRWALLFRAVEYAKEMLVDTIGALVMIGRWPNVNAGRINPRQVWEMLRCSPELVATVVRNLLVWSPWAWMTMSRNVEVGDVSERSEQ